jgi:hypothetical protein
MHDVDTVGILKRQLVGELTGAVGATVVNHEDVHLRLRRMNPGEDDRQVAALVVRRDYDQRAWAGIIG